MLLRTIDSLWVEHLTELDDMRRGIGLRGYAQQDPLNEFRKEAFRLYEELSDLIRRQVATTIFRVTVRREPETVPLPGPGQPARVAAGAGAPDGGSERRRDGRRPCPRRRGPPLAAGQAALRQPAAGLAGSVRGTRPPRRPDAQRARGPRVTPRSAGGSVRPGFTPSGARIGRNEPCWCGSGQKYKKCHGA